MPPKLANFRPPSNKSSSAARKSVPRAAKKSNPHSSLPTTIAAVDTPASTAFPTSPDVFGATRPGAVAAPTIISEYDEPRATNPLFKDQFGHSERTTVSNSSLAMSDKSSSGGGNANQCSVTSAEPEKAVSLEAEIVRESGYGSTCQQISPNVKEALPYGQDGRSKVCIPKPESEVSETVVGNGKKKVVKRIVRVVRKVIKKVPKKVPKNGLGNLETGVLSNQVAENLNLVNDMSESGNEIEKMETSNLNVDARFLEPAQAQSGICLTVNDALEAQNLQNDDQAVDVDRMCEVNIPSAMELGGAIIETESADKSAMSEGMEDTVDKKATSTCESFMKGDLSECLGGFREENAKENWILDSDKDEDVEPVIDQKISLVEDIPDGFSGNHNGNLKRKIVSGRDKDEKKVNHELEGDSIMLNSGLLLSGELEALERKKRRKTEIFVGGLSKDTMEDDIWGVFKVAGKIVRVRLAMNAKTGKNKGFAFVRFATAADAKNALEKYSKVEIRGIQCDVAAVEGNDTIFLGNIDRKWKTEDVVKFLGKARVDVEKIEVVILKSNPNNMANNRGFAFVEFETNKDAQNAFIKLNKDFIGKNMNIKISWAKPLIEPTEEEILKVKSVYAEFLPSSWDEEKVRKYFERFGAIDNVVLAKDFASSRRKDFAFINYSTRDSALACIEVVNRERTENDCSKIKIAVSLANPTPKTKERKPASDLSSKQLYRENPRALQDNIKLHEPRNRVKPTGSSSDVAKVGRRSSTNDELVQILRQQASARTTVMEHHHSSSGSKRPFSLLGDDQFYLEPTMLPQATRMESPYRVSGQSDMFRGVNTASLPYYHHHHPAPDRTTESFTGRRIYRSSFQTSRADPYLRSSTWYQPYHRY